MFQISANISALNTEQREAIAAFILSFPQGSPRNIYNSQDIEDEESVIIPSFSVHEEQSPETVFAAVPLVSDVPSGPVLVPNPSNLDKNGIPWDERIHSSSRVKTADGSWRMKRGVDEVVAANVTSELKALMGIPAPPPPPAPVSAATIAATLGHAYAVPAPVADTPAATVVAVPAPPAPDGDRNAFIALIGKASNAISAKKLTQEQLNSAVVAAGVPSLQLLANRMDLVPSVSATLDAMIGA